MFRVDLRTDKKRADLATSPVKGSLNLKVSKGPEETTCRNRRLLKISTWVEYVRVSPDLLEAGLNNPCLLCVTSPHLSN
jgi:hypothetical protein